MSAATATTVDAAAPWVAACTAAAAAPGAAPWAAALRRRGAEAFATLRWPNRRAAGWEHTDLSAVAARPLGPAPAGRPDGATGTDRAEVAARLAALPALGDARLVFVDGHYVAALSTPPTAAGVTATPLAPATRADGAAAAALVGHTADDRGQPLVALNAAYLLDGAVVTFAAAAAPRTVELVFFAHAAAPCMAHPRVVVVAEAGSRGGVIERHVGTGNTAQVTNAVTEVTVGAGARLAYGVLQEAPALASHLGHLAAAVAEGGHLAATIVAAGAALARHTLQVRLRGRGATVALAGVAAAAGEGRRDIQVQVLHEAAGCVSDQNFRGVFGGHATGAFGGQVQVALDAQQTKATQLSKNLLLTSTARAHAQPQLTILADDVSCTHGATVGALREEALFYLMSRGIGAEDARRLLTVAFAREALAALPAPAAAAATAAVCGALGLAAGDLAAGSDLDEVAS